jgi:SAM-dependent methyltransferase
VKRCINCEFSFEGATWLCPACGAGPMSSNGFVAFAPNLDHIAAGFSESHFALLASLEAGNFWFQARNRLIAWALARYFPAATSFLEIGCGTGFVLSSVAEQFPQLCLSGSEVYSAGLRYAAQRVSHAHLFQADARRIPFEGEFDVIGAFDVLEHIEDDRGVLAQMHRALVPGGGLILTVPQHPCLWSPQDEYACHVRRYGTRELVAKVRTAGFTIVRTTSFVSLLMPLLIASRWRKQARREQFDALDESRMGPTANAALGAVMAVERVLIRSGVSFPAGGSRLVIARKKARLQ